VAAPDHPLSKIGEVSSGEARKHVQLVLTDRSPLTEGRDFSVLSPRTWRLADLGAKHALLREGIGWGNMPLPMVEGELAGGDLVRLKMRDHPGGTYRLAGIWRRDAPPGPAASWLLNQFEVLGAGDEIPPDLPDI
jgi:DNA-binding transcriptional LysR family regulator